MTTEAKCADPLVGDSPLAQRCALPHLHESGCACGYLYEIERLEQLVYVPGHWRCPKCKLYLVSTNIHMPSGKFSANSEPHQCANGCGPMWRVTEREAGNRLIDQGEKQHEALVKIATREVSAGHHEAYHRGWNDAAHIAREALHGNAS